MTSLQTNWSSMAWVYAHENGFSDLVVLNENKHIQGSLKGHLFIVNGTKISTPSVNDGAIKSVYRKKMIDCIEAATDFTIEEVSLTPFVLQRANELFVLENAVALHQITAQKKTYPNHYPSVVFNFSKQLGQLVVFWVCVCPKRNSPPSFLKAIAHNVAIGCSNRSWYR